MTGEELIKIIQELGADRQINIQYQDEYAIKQTDDFIVRKEHWINRSDECNAIVLEVNGE